MTLSADIESTIAAPTTRKPARTYIPIAGEWVRSSKAPTIHGLAKPARLAIELMIAIPAAAAEPLRMAVGNDQKSGAHDKTPAVAKDRKIIDTVVLVAVAAMIKPKAPIRAGTTRCQRRSRCLSALRENKTMAIIAQIKGIAPRRPIIRLSSTPDALINVGNHKVNPYCPITKQK